jgi:DNA repair photolyase
MSAKISTIYTPTGRALEYSLLALNLYTGCSHRCDYCFAPGCLRKTREVFHANVKPRPGIIEALKREAPKFAHTNERVLLCFHCDPYSPEAAASGVTRQALEVLREYDVPFQILTKGGMRASHDFDLYGPNDAFATTLTTLSRIQSAKYEPGAAVPMDRRNAIFTAHEQGIKTWVSLEPVLYPEWALDIIAETHRYVDLYKVGKLNHDAVRERQINWKRFAQEAMFLLNKYGKPFIFKKDLRAYCDFEIVGECKDDPRLVRRSDTLRQVPQKGEEK